MGRILEDFFGIHAVMMGDPRDMLVAVSSTSGVYIGSIEVLHQPAPTDHDIGRYILTLREGDTTGIDTVRDRLIEGGYEYSLHVSRAGTYRIDGDTLHIHPYGQTVSYRVSFFDREIDGIMTVTPDT